MTAMSALAFGKALVSAGLMTEDELCQTRRVVIDCTEGHAVMFYTEKFGDTDGLTALVPMLKGLIPE